VIPFTLISITCLTKFTSASGLTPDLKRKIDARLAEAKSKNIDLFSDKKCGENCFGKAVSKADLEQITAFLGVKPETGTDQISKENVTSHKQEMTVFVSNSMPKAALKGLVLEAEKMKTHKIRFVIQGMVKGSMPGTAQLVEDIGHPLEIDPKLFEVYHVTHVPVFMTKREEKVYRVQGNVTLDFALSKFTENVDGNTTSEADRKKT
jgi:type-F conjugative transfer system pilin assembly protein TrbC